jgi:hypothetical protein
MNPRLIYRFDKIIGVSFERFLKSSQEFFTNHYQPLYDFFSGNSDSLPKESFKKLKELDNQREVIQNSFLTKSFKLNEYEFWEIVDMVEEISTKISTTLKLDKWLRSVNTSLSYNNGTSFKYMLRNNQSVDSAVRYNMGDVDEEVVNDLMIKNSLQERDLPIEGGVEINIFTSQSNSSVTNVSTVIDNPLGKKIYGKDLQKHIEWDTDNNDLKVLDYDQTLQQTINIMGSLQKSSVPEFEEIGFDYFAGKTIGSLSKPLLIRQLNEIFAQDDIFVGIEVTEMKFIQDGIYVKYNITTVLNNVIKNQEIRL